MTLLVLAVLLAILAAGFVIHPLVFRRWGVLGDAVSPDLADSDARRRVALAALKDVEYDHAAGKLDDADYQALRGRLELEALQAVNSFERHSAAGPEAMVHGCGFRNPSGSRFCAGCGQRIA